MQLRQNTDVRLLVFITLDDYGLDYIPCQGTHLIELTFRETQTALAWPCLA